MPEHHLHRADVGAIGKQVGGEHMPQHVRSDSFGNSGDRRVMPDDSLDGMPVQVAVIFAGVFLGFHGERIIL